MLGLTIQEVSRALDATLRGKGDRRIARVVVDSRKLGPGDLFVALPGARTDGHAFLREAHQAGAAAALVQPDRGLRPPGLPVLIVPNTLASLADLARFHAGRLKAEVLGVTGTVGKTTAKDFLTQLLGGEEAGVHGAPASYNSEIGLPLAVLGARAGTDRMVLEYGINAPGEMDHLLSIVRPRHAWITALGSAHLEGMGSFETVVEEKCRLARAVPEGGHIWLPEELGELVSDRAQTWCGRVRLTGLDGKAGRARLLEARPMAWRVEIPRVGEVTLPVVARHEALLAATAAQAALDLGIAPQQVAARLASLVRPVGRLTFHEFGAVRVLDDSYNASPQALRAALEVLAEWPGATRRVAVLGTMHELGCAAEGLHREAGEQLAGLPLDWVMAIGRGGAWIAEAARAAGSRAEIHVVDDAAAAAAAIERRVQPGDVVLLKASRAEGLERLLPSLDRARGRGPADRRGGRDANERSAQGSVG